MKNPVSPFGSIAKFRARVKNVTILKGLISKKALKLKGSLKAGNPVQSKSSK
jgi:hypothetical protein